jgi:hypothetical protein
MINQKSSEELKQYTIKLINNIPNPVTIIYIITVAVAGRVNHLHHNAKASLLFRSLPFLSSVCLSPVVTFRCVQVYPLSEALPFNPLHHPLLPV